MTETVKKTNFQFKKDFDRAFNGEPKKVPYYNVSNEKVALAIRLIREEYAELLAEVQDGDGNFIGVENIIVEDVLKESGDLLYVTYGLFNTLGFDADMIFKAIHNSNMTKLGPDGKPIYREDGKILKSENYKPVDLSNFVLANQAGVPSEYIYVENEDIVIRKSFCAKISGFFRKITGIFRN